MTRRERPTTYYLLLRTQYSTGTVVLLMIKFQKKKKRNAYSPFAYFNIDFKYLQWPLLSQMSPSPPSSNKATGVPPLHSRPV